MYKGEGVPFDPEGIMSTIPAIAEVIFGYIIGDYIQKKGKNHEMVSGLFVAGSTMIITGFAGTWFSRSIKRYGQVLILFILPAWQQ